MQLLKLFYSAISLNMLRNIGVRGQLCAMALLRTRNITESLF